MGGMFPELKRDPAGVCDLIKSEEVSFGRTLVRGLELFDEAAARAEAQSGVDYKVISGDDAFRLHDTFGFPFDLTQIIAHERGLKVDAAMYSFKLENAVRFRRKVESRRTREWLIFLSGARRNGEARRTHNR